MFRRDSVIVALASSMWKLVSAWWKVDRIQIPHSRRDDSGEGLLEDAVREVDSARSRRTSSKVQTTTP
jgi:hypothetical protein